MSRQQNILPRRRSIRLADYDYSTEGAYFITICTFHNECTLGEIEDGGIILSDCGKIARREWYKSAAMRPGVNIDEFIIMPNHLHGIVIISHGEHSAGGLRPPVFDADYAADSNTIHDRRFGPPNSIQVKSLVIASLRDGHARLAAAKSQQDLC
jgi:hypothetical protein